MAYLLPFLASLIYVTAALFFKQASDRGAGVLRSTGVTNLFCGIAFNGLWILGGRFPDPTPWGQPALVGFLFLAGQLLGFLAIQRGDVSVATPVMGIKVVAVAVLVTLLIGTPVRALLWVAAVLCSAGIVLLSRAGRGPASGRVLPAVAFGMLSAGCFALFDVLVQKWSPAWGAGRFLPVMMSFTAIYSLVLLALLREPVRGPGGAPLWAGAACMSFQAVLLISSLALYNKATAINIVYSARGLWSVLAVWLVGHWFGNRERERGADVLRGRLLGAGLLMAAIVLAVIGGR
jgi:drug/metabolite transporter (DMT)-like permease